MNTTTTTIITADQVTDAASFYQYMIQYVPQDMCDKAYQILCRVETACKNHPQWKFPSFDYHLPQTEEDKICICFSWIEEYKNLSCIVTDDENSTSFITHSCVLGLPIINLEAACNQTQSNFDPQAVADFIIKYQF